MRREELIKKLQQQGNLLKKENHTRAQLDEIIEKKTTIDKINNKTRSNQSKYIGKRRKPHKYWDWVKPYKKYDFQK